MLLFFAILLFAAILFALWRVVRRLHKIPALGALPVAIALFVGLESVIYNSLSLAHLVTPAWVVGSHLGVLGVWLAWEIRYRKSHLKAEWLCLYRAARQQMTRQRALLPLLFLLLITALIYPPNNWDSMTYHMARVAHWMQNRSVAYYPTSIDRQNVMGPGAEYLILFFQILTKSDFLANCIQLLSYIIILLSLEYIGRLIHLPCKMRVWVAVICVTAPMALMQATSTQNDLVASMMFLAVIISGARIFCGKIGRMQKEEYFLFGASIGSAFLVKPTALVVAGPLFIGASLYQFRNLAKPSVMKKATAGVLIALIATSVIAGPDIVRKGVEAVHRPAVYSLFSGWSSTRLWNPIAIMGQNIPFPQKVKSVLHTVGFKGKLYTGRVFFPHEDYVGNTLQVVLLLGLTLLTLALIIPAALAKGHGFSWALLSLYPAAAWVTFALMVRNQPWVTRIQLPLLFALPFAFALIFQILRNYRRLRKAFEVVICVIAFFSLAQGYVAACNNQTRHLKIRFFWDQFPSREDAYYKNRGGENAADHLLKTAESLQCNRIGLIIGGDSYDYPLTWRAMQKGMQTRHIQSASQSNWACMLYVSDVSPKRMPHTGDGWLPASGDGKSFYRNPTKATDTSFRICAQLKDKHDLRRIKPLKQVSVSYVPDGLLIQSDGIDPQILLPPITCTHAGQPVLKIVMNSFVKTVLQVFYLTPKENRYAPWNSIRKKIFKGENILFIRIPPKALSKPLRLDPGQRPGRYLLRSIDVMLVSQKPSEKEGQVGSWHRTSWPAPEKIVLEDTVYGTKPVFPVDFFAFMVGSA